MDVLDDLRSDEGPLPVKKPDAHMNVNDDSCVINRTSGISLGLWRLGSQMMTSAGWPICIRCRLPLSLLRSWRIMGCLS